MAEVHHRLIAVIDTLEEPYEIIFVDDGSSDRTFALLEASLEVDGRTIILSRTVEVEENYARRRSGRGAGPHG